MDSRKPTATNVALNNGNNSTHISNKSYQNGNNPDSNYSMFDYPQADVEYMNRPLTKKEFRFETRGEEFHWMANAAYNQSK